jgi:outer membrane protein assembly factor BamE (lipoprotein component of BamABCDE complex)
MKIIAAARLSVIVLMSMTLAGCPVPMTPGDFSGSRLNVGDRVPDFIVVGRTTREEVLLALGEPDGISEHSEWFVYLRTASTGGMAFVVAAGGGVGGAFIGGISARRLVIHFDDDGVVKSAKHKFDSCSANSVVMGNASSENSKTEPCLRKAPDDVATKEVLASAQSTTNPPYQAFTSSWWHPGVRGFERLSQFQLEDPPTKGTLVVGMNSVRFISADSDSQSDPLLKVEYPAIAEVYVDSFGFSRRVVIKRTNGAYESFSITSGSWTDAAYTESAGATIKSRWQEETSK